MRQETQQNFTKGIYKLIMPQQDCTNEQSSLHMQFWLCRCVLSGMGIQIKKDLIMSQGISLHQRAFSWKSIQWYSRITFSILHETLYIKIQLNSANRKDHRKHVDTLRKSPIEVLLKKVRTTYFFMDKYEKYKFFLVEGKCLILSYDRPWMDCAFHTQLSWILLFIFGT